MDSSVRSEYLNEVKKTITEDCSARCFLQQNEKCLKQCYNSYIKSFNITTRTLRSIGYKRNSRYINLAYGDGLNEWEKISYFNDLEPDVLGYPVPYLENYVFDDSKSK